MNHVVDNVIYPLAMTNMRYRSLAILAVISLLLISCSSTEPAATTQASSATTTTVAPLTSLAPVTTTTTTVPETTTTTEPPIEVFNSINGLWADEDLIDRRLVGVKIDNHPNARPQSALQSADAVFEIIVEGGITRFIALFHQTDLEWAGPTRSGRPTDSSIMATFGEAPFQISGAQLWIKKIFRSNDVNVMYESNESGTTFRYSDRSAPHNLYTSTVLIRGWADAKGWSDEGPGNIFTFGDPTQTEGTATTIEVQYSDAAPPTWEWDGASYLRFHGDEPHTWIDNMGETGQVVSDTIVVMRMEEYVKSDPQGQGSSVPAMVTTGSGEVFVFHSGEVASGTWERENITDMFVLTNAEGDELVLPPGRIWISLQPNNQTLLWE